MKLKKSVTFPAYVMVECAFTSEKKLCKTRDEALELIQFVSDEEDAERLSYAVEVTIIYSTPKGKIKVHKYDSNEYVDSDDFEPMQEV